MKTPAGRGPVDSKGAAATHGLANSVSSISRTLLNSLRCGTVASPIALDFDKAYPQFGGGPAVIPAGNLSGQPALSVPNGFGQNGLPTGIQLVGRIGDDVRLMRVALFAERALSLAQ